MRTQSFSVRRTRSALPFCCEVYEQESLKTVPCSARKLRMANESYSLLLSVCRARTERPN